MYQKLFDWNGKSKATEEEQSREEWEGVRALNRTRGWQVRELFFFSHFQSSDSEDPQPAAPFVLPLYFWGVDPAKKGVMI